jgi:hypothetical protein
VVILYDLINSVITAEAQNVVVPKKGLTTLIWTIWRLKIAVPINTVFILGKF